MFLREQKKHWRKWVRNFAEYLGSFITPSSSSNSDVSFRCPQASHAFKCLDPFFRHTLIFPRRKLQVYSQIVQSILLHGSGSQSPALITRFDSLHCKPLRQIFQIKSPDYHSNPSDAPFLKSISSITCLPCPSHPLSSFH